MVSNQEEAWTPNYTDLSLTTTRGTVFTIPADGTWFAHVTAKDKAGNLSLPARYRLQVDSQAQAPLLRSSTHPLNQWVKVSTPKFLWDRPARTVGRGRLLHHHR